MPRSAMSVGLSSVAVLVLCGTLSPRVSAGSWDCESYTDQFDDYHPSVKCRGAEFCCGTCQERYCCRNSFLRLSEDKQDECIFFRTSSPLPMVFGIVSLVSIILIVICCCVCPCCCLYKMCRKPQPVIATTTHTTVVTSTPQQYPQQPTAAAAAQPQSYQGAQYPPYQSIPVQPGYGTQPTPQGYGAQPMTTSPYHMPPFTAGPPPTYQEATGPGYPPNPMPYSQAAFTPDQPAYPLQPPAEPQQPQQPNAPHTHNDYLGQPAYNPDYVAPPPKTG